MSAGRPEVQSFYHEPSGTVTYLVIDPPSRVCAVIDPVVDFSMVTGKLGEAPLDPIVAEIERRNLTLDWILETHVHADHVTGAPALKRRVGGRIAIGDQIAVVQQAFAGVYDEGPDFPTDGSQFDHLLRDGEEIRIGNLEGEALSTPGHTPACMAYHIADAIFVGDTVFMPDFGTARCDFPGGDARQLFQSVRRLLELPAETRVFVGHDYGPDGRGIAWETTIGELRHKNKHVRDGISEDEFVEMREARDAQLGLPGMIIPAIQINMRAGQLPAPAGNGISYIKVPVNGFPGA